MTSVSAIDANTNNQASYNAVKVKINKPQTTIPEDFKGQIGNGIYNAVNIEIDEPSVEITKDCKKHKKVYDYPVAKDIVTYDMSGLSPLYIVDLPTPFAYQANLINNKTFVAADIVFDDKEDIVVENEAEIEVPAPNLTTTENEKASKEMSFKGIAFKSNDVEIVPPTEIKPEVDLHQVINNLSDPSFDKQALQMEEIARIAMETPSKAIPYIVTEVFTNLINIANKDTSGLEAPTKEQIEVRKQIIVNEIVKEQSIAEGKKPEEIELPYNLTQEEMISAATISPMEQAERNKEYALYTIAILDKIYIDEVEKETGNVIPLTDLPGISEIVDTLRYDENPSVKVSAIDALRYISRDEYNEELKTVLNLATKDNSEYVARNALAALQSIQ